MNRFRPSPPEAHAADKTCTARRHALGVLGAGFAALAAGPAFAQPAPFPNRVVRIVPFGSPGGPMDAIARVYAEKLKARWNQPVIVEARPGASGTIAADAVAKAAPDGYTVLLTLPLTHINNVVLQPKLPYDPVKDFEPLSQLATGGPMLVARASAPFSTVREFVAYAKAHPGVSYGTWGNGSNAHLFGELLARQNHIDLVHVPYKAEAAAHNDMFGEALGVAWANPATARGLAQAGRIKVLGITGRQRVRSMPNVPTFTEQGFAGFDLDSWIGVYAPARTPQPVLDEWSLALREITKLPDIQERLAGYGFEALGSTPAEFRAGYKADFPRVADLIKAAGVTPE
ncbi:tripartite-type tricarboxylate transporter receptor subunit TctC [Variovorax boronicumulans]|uniref:Bug family tripartite tricarboxylate transporter substrate binding protein n=1 Tax=Variovorax TaxID=34072 RepID=UPI00278056FD|nr:tripartite tricarboxylate transporter substrate binding protein [Variovorax boronicumulans]MDP9908098.1 tripartite-type tricarboxylate transporter receptor subunit TctC [Variovorax boronicumulans]